MDLPVRKEVGCGGAMVVIPTDANPLQVCRSSTATATSPYILHHLSNRVLYRNIISLFARSRWFVTHK